MQRMQQHQLQRRQHHLGRQEHQKLDDKEEEEEEAVLKFWEDVKPPSFVITDKEEKRKNREILDDYNKKGAHVTHFCFLVHGHRGFRKDLSYLQTVMGLMADQKKRSLVGEAFRHDIVVHSAVCNEHRTTDGVVNGGKRLVEEMLDTIRTAMEQRPTPPAAKGTPNQPQLRDVTISIVGNSLGGLYARYAIAQFQNFVPRNDHGDNVLDGKYRIHFNVFCTTASPHLGLSKHTYLPLPRSAEIGLAHTMGNTGKDLFRLNDLMKTMATTPEFLKPLGNFRKRLAYANAYGTDFPVPAETAAFLSAESNYPHHFVEDSEQGGDCVVVDGTGLVIATMQTPPLGDEGTPRQIDQENTDDLVHMSRALDSLGWKKVFVDIRNEIPYRMSLPRLSSRRIPTFEDSSSSEEEQPPALSSLDALKQKKVVCSKDVASAITTPADDDGKVVWPMGHNMIVAFSRDKYSTRMNKGGRPVVDALAKELVDDIFSWESPNKPI